MKTFFSPTLTFSWPSFWWFKLKFMNRIFRAWVSSRETFTAGKSLKNFFYFYDNQIEKNIYESPTLNYLSYLLRLNIYRLNIFVIFNVDDEIELYRLKIYL